MHRHDQLVGVGRDEATGEQWFRALRAPHVPQPGEAERPAALEREVSRVFLIPRTQPFVKAIGGNEAPLLAELLPELVPDRLRPRVDRSRTFIRTVRIAGHQSPF